MITAEITGAENITALINQIAARTEKGVPQLIKQASIFAIQSAVKATKPGTAKNPRVLPAKYKFRPIRKAQARDGEYWYRRYGKIFVVPRKLTATEAAGAEFIKDREIEVWADADRHKAIWMPYRGEAAGKYDKNSKIGKIPHAGAAKGAWYGALAKLYPADGQGGADYGRGSRAKQEIGNGFFTNTFENRIKYMDIINPYAAERGMQAAEARLKATYKRFLPDAE